MATVIHQPALHNSVAKATAKHTAICITMQCRCFSWFAVYTALSSSSTQPSIREAAVYLGIDQHVQAPELTNPPRMPQCISSRKLSSALTAAINIKYAGQLKMNASVDTTYIQVKHIDDLMHRLDQHGFRARLLPDGRL